MEGTSGGEAGQRPCLGAYRGFWIRALGRSRNWGGAADPLTLRRLSSSASAEEGILKGPPIVAMRDRGCAPKCGSRRGFLRGRKCAGGRGPSGENYSGLQFTVYNLVIATQRGFRSSSTFHDILLLDARSSCGVRPETRALGDHAGADARRWRFGHSRSAFGLADSARLARRWRRVARSFHPSLAKPSHPEAPSRTRAWRSLAA